MTRHHAEFAVSGDPVLAVDRDLRIAAWNAALEELTGVDAVDALGQPCWAVLRGRGAVGASLCRRSCAVARDAFDGVGHPRRQDLTILTKDGSRVVSVSTVVLNDRPEALLVHVLGDGAPNDDGLPSAGTHSARLTSRQLQVLRLLAARIPARAIAGRLGLGEATVRNHIRAVLVAFEAHSQLEAVARARAQGVLRGDRASVD